MKAQFDGTESLRTRTVYGGFLVLAASLPFSGLLQSWLLILTLFGWIVYGRWREKLETLRSQKWVAFPLALYLLYAVGMLYSENLAEAGFKMEQKLALPLVCMTFASLPVSTSSFQNWLMRALVTALCVSALFNEVRAVYRFLELRTDDVFLYTEYSYFLHPTYNALLLNVGLAGCLLSFLQTNVRSRKISWSMLLLAVFFSVNTLQSSSRAGVLSLAFVWLAVIAAAWYRRSVITKGVYAGLVVLLALTAAMILAFSQRLRLQAMRNAARVETVSPTTSESSQTRVLVWRESWQLVLEQPWIGYGTGDVNDVLKSRYEATGMMQAAEYGLNAHNQYLQNWLANGLLSVLALCAWLCYAAAVAYRLRHWLALTFFVLIAFNFLFESILERREGLFVFAVLSSVFLSRMHAARHEKSSSPKLS